MFSELALENIFLFLKSIFIFLIFIGFLFKALIWFLKSNRLILPVLITVFEPFCLEIS